MDVLRVYPEFPDTFWSFKHALKFVRKKGRRPAAWPVDGGGHVAFRGDYSGYERLRDL